MANVIVRAKPFEVTNRLIEFGLTRQICVEIVEAAVMGRTGCSENDPPGARGYESYRWGTRRARELLRGRGWEKEDIGGLACVVNHDKRLRMIIMNADDGTGTLDRVPQNRCKKGAASERVATSNWLFTPEEMYIPAADSKHGSDGYSTWHLCIYTNDETVRAELTLLSDFENGYFTGFVEKIIVLADGEWPPGKPKGNEGDEGDDEYEVKVLRR